MWILQNGTNLNNVLPFLFILIYNHVNQTASEEKRTSALMLTFVCFKNLGLVYRRVRSGTGSAKLHIRLPSAEHPLFLAIN
jgi:hypothetical protein